MIVDDTIERNCDVITFISQKIIFKKAWDIQKRV